MTWRRQFEFLVILTATVVTSSGRGADVEQDPAKKQVTPARLGPPVRWLWPHESAPVSVMSSEMAILERIGEAGLRVGMTRAYQPGEIPFFG